MYHFTTELLVSGNTEVETNSILGHFRTKPRDTGLLRQAEGINGLLHQQ